jgi:AcrR family transcriptional regulator
MLFLPRQATPVTTDPRARLLEAARRTLEQSGPEALQARGLTAEVGMSTQALYTHFGGMPGLLHALAEDGFARFAQHVAAVTQTDDPVADFFTEGAAYCEWALAHPHHYRLMFGLTGGRPRQQTGFELTRTGTPATFPEGQAATAVLVRALDRVIDAGRIRPVESVIVAGQFLSATHGYVLLDSAGSFGHEGQGLEVVAQLVINLMVGLGDSREAAERSLLAAGRSWRL